MLGVYLGLNLGTHFDIDRRQGLKLGGGLDASPSGILVNRMPTRGVGAKDELKLVGAATMDTSDQHAHFADLK
jgi:hypothetical protein